jgi:hypothetical protein
VILEPDVTLTDLALAVQGSWLGALLARSGAARPARRWWAGFFGSVAVGALLGGISHGFVPTSSGGIGTALWRLTLLAIGAAALSAWGAAAQTLGESAARLVIAMAIVLFGAYVAVVLFVTDAFIVAIVHYAPAAVFLLGALLRCWWRTRVPAALAGVAGLLTLALGSVVQATRLALHPVYLTHNAVYHLFEMLALWLLYRAARWLSAEGSRC